MSHTTTIDLQVKDEAAFVQACQDLGFAVEQNTTAQLYQAGSRFTDATAVTLPGWNYPVVLKDGALHFDNYKGRWGEASHLDKLKQRYARNVAVKTARSKGYRIKETTTNDGQIKLVLTR